MLFTTTVYCFLAWFTSCVCNPSLLISHFHSCSRYLYFFLVLLEEESKGLFPHFPANLCITHLSVSLKWNTFSFQGQKKKSIFLHVFSICMRICAQVTYLRHQKILLCSYHKKMKKVCEVCKISYSKRYNGRQRQSIMPHSFEDLIVFDTEIMTLQGDIIKH